MRKFGVGNFRNHQQAASPAEADERPVEDCVEAGVLGGFAAYILKWT